MPLQLAALHQVCEHREQSSVTSLCGRVDRDAQEGVDEHLGHAVGQHVLSGDRRALRDLQQQIPQLTIL